MTEINIRPIEADDRHWINQLITERWGSEIVVIHDTIYTPGDLDGFVAEKDGKSVGLVSYIVEKEQCEVVTLDSLLPSAGVGSRLIDAVRQVAEEAGCRRVWVVTTNDNIDALRFYQRRGFSLVAIHRDAVIKARKKKSQIPIIGQHGIPIQDEIELELELG